MTRTRAPALITLADACRRAGISRYIALNSKDFPSATMIGTKLFVSRERFEAWLSSKINDSSSAA